MGTAIATEKSACLSANVAAVLPRALIVILVLLAIWQVRIVFLIILWGIFYRFLIIIRVLHLIFRFYSSLATSARGSASWSTSRLCLLLLLLSRRISWTTFTIIDNFRFRAFFPALFLIVIFFTLLTFKVLLVAPLLSLTPSGRSWRTHFGWIEISLFLESCRSLRFTQLGSLLDFSHLFLLLIFNLPLLILRINSFKYPHCNR